MAEINPRLIEREYTVVDDQGNVSVHTRPIAPAISQIPEDRPTGFINDSDWVRTSFLISNVNLDEARDRNYRFWSTANAKFTDSRLGCNIGINPKPQYTMYTDIPVKGRLSGRQDVKLTTATGNYGMGRYWSEAIDDPAQRIYMQFGVPQFNSLTSFLRLAFSPDQIALAKTGRVNQALFKAGKIAGTAAALVAFPAISVGILAGRAISGYFYRPSSKFYTLKPAMHSYWSAVNTLVQSLTINRGIFPTVTDLNYQNGTGEGGRPGMPFKLDQEYIELLSDIMPDVFSGGTFDAFAMAAKAQSLANQLQTEDFKAEESGDNFVERMMSHFNDKGEATDLVTDQNKQRSLFSIINELTKLSYYVDNGDSSNTEFDPRVVDEGGNQETINFSSYAKYFDSMYRDGAAFAVFRVDHTGSMSESFSNSVVESEISQTLNATSSQMRNIRFSMAEGNIVGDTVKSATDAVVSLLTGAASGVTLGFSDILLGLGGNGYIDIPKHWQSSSAQLPRATYTMQLVSPYGNDISQLINIDVPLCMLLAGTLPISTGKQSYTSPFLCQIFDRGRCQVRLGMIENLTITRGTTNLNFTYKGRPNGVEVSFTVADLSSIMHMPLTVGTFMDHALATVEGATNSILGRAEMTLDEDNILSDYLAVLAGQDIYSQVYPMSKAKIAFAKRLARTQMLTSSPAYWASLHHDMTTQGILSWIPVGKVLEGVVRGSSVISGPIDD